MPDKDKLPLLSVCLQTYQHAAFIEQCLESVLAQKTSFPFEIIIGEDESTDGTREICMRYAAKYPNLIRLHLNSRKDVIYIEGSATGRFNFLQNLRSAKGKYICLIEGDDYWTDEYKLQKQVDLLEREADVQICFHECKRQFDASFQRADDLVTFSVLKKYKTYYEIEDLIEHEWFMATASVMFRNDFPDPLPEFMYQSISGDIPLYYILLRNGGRIKMLEEVMSVYRKNRGGITVNLDYVKQVYTNRIRLYRALNVYFANRFETAFEKRIRFFENKIAAANAKPGLSMRLIRKLKGFLSR